MKLALAVGLGVFVIGFSTGNSQEVDRNHLVSAPVPAPAGFEKAVENAQEYDRAHLVSTRIAAPAGFEKAVDEAMARAAAAVRTPRRCEAKNEPCDTSRAVLNAENAALERPIPRTNFFGRW